MEKFLVFQTASGLLRVQPRHILYIKAEGNYSVLYARDGSDYLLSNQLGQIDRFIDSLAEVRDTFRRIGRGLIVNLHYVSLVNTKRGFLKLSDMENFSIELEASQAALKELKEHIESRWEQEHLEMSSFKILQSKFDKISSPSVPALKREEETPITREDHEHIRNIVFFNSAITEEETPLYEISGSSDLDEDFEVEFEEIKCPEGYADGYYEEEIHEAEINEEVKIEVLSPYVWLERRTLQNLEGEYIDFEDFDTENLKA